MKKLKPHIKNYFMNLILVDAMHLTDLCDAIEAQYNTVAGTCFEVPKEWLNEYQPKEVHMYIPLNDEMFEERTRFYPDSGAWYPMSKFEDALFGCSDSIVYRNKNGNIQTHEGGAIEFAVIHDVPS